MYSGIHNLLCPMVCANHITGIYLIMPTVRELSQIKFAFFGIFWPCTSLVCTFYVVNYTFFWPPTHPKCKRNLWKLPYTDPITEMELTHTVWLCMLLSSLTSKSILLSQNWKSSHFFVNQLFLADVTYTKNMKTTPSKVGYFSKIDKIFRTTRTAH